MSSDPSQSAAQAAGRQDRALQEKHRAKLQEGALTGFEERNTKWDVEYEGKDAVGTLVRPFEPGWGDSRQLPSKMLGETAMQSVARGMGRNMPHSGMGDGKKVFKTDEDPDRLRKMIADEASKDGVPKISGHDESWMSPTQKKQMRHLKKMEKRYPGSPVMKEGKFDASTVTSRASPNAVRHRKKMPMSPEHYMALASVPKTKQLANEGAHDMLDRCGPNVLSGPIPRDGMTTDIYEDRSRDRLHQMGWSDIMGETGERPDEISNGIDHLDKLEHLGKSAKDLQYTAGFTGNEGLYNAKLNVMQ